jgi:hypothetical protein
VVAIPEPAVAANANDLRTILVSGGSAILASLLTIILPPSMRHYFWKRQHLTELRVQATDEVNKLTSALVANVIAQEHRGASYAPFVEFWERWHACDRRIRVFFSPDVYKRMEVLMNAGTGINHGQIDAFIDTQTDALRALYQEAGVIAPPNLARIRKWGRLNHKG